VREVASVSWQFDIELSYGVYQIGEL
jgi:hypothetical protein